MSRSPTDGFSAFVADVGAPLRQALIAAYGPNVGPDATADALEYAWQHWDQLRVMHNPVGYLYRVGQSKARRGIFRRSPSARFDAPARSERWFEPGLPGAMAALSERQRAALVLVHGFEWTVSEVAELWGVTFSTVKTHLERGLESLRSRLGIEDVG